MKIEPGLIQSKNLIGVRECVHCPVVVVTSDCEIVPGEYVKFINYSFEDKVIPWYNTKDSHGIADPFLIDNVPINTPFNVFLLPSKVKNIHHEFDIEL